MGKSVPDNSSLIRGELATIKPDMMCRIAPNLLVSKFLTLSLFASCAHAFSGTANGVPFLHESASPMMQQSVMIASLATPGSSLFDTYMQTLAEYPLETKMATAAVLAVAGDAIAQSREPEEYDPRRASSFMVFDVAYRALQHKLFPILVSQFHGEILVGAVSGFPLLVNSVTPRTVEYLAAMEQTLANQLVVVPFLYYPVFFSLTGAIQGLTVDAAIERAKENFWPLLKRNLLFWIPVQFVQFSFVEEDLQVPFLCICGLAWTVILSVMAGSTKGYSDDDKPYCVIGIEDECELPDELFPVSKESAPDAGAEEIELISK
mmetsp:Transcript_25701/g.36257  ORF Transcript_25701/g.36257 Transcript_25701/m.36257 type:complete len:320 (-) Transcript_25701:41-1000(-)